VIAPIMQSRFGLMGRVLAVCALGVLGVTLGWTMRREQTTTADWLLAALSVVSALIVAVEAVRTSNRRASWIMIVCGLVAARGVYELVRLALR
jgi:hypothetical protein